MVSTSFGTILIVASCLVSSGELQSTSEFYKNSFSNNSALPEATNDWGNSGDVMVKDGDHLSIRLPTSVMPSHYLVRLQPFINGNLSIEGYVEISLDVKEATRRLILHINDIVTKNETAKVYRMDDPTSEIEITSQEYDHERQFYILNLGEMMQEGVAYVLALSFEGFLNDDLKGFYRSSYKDDDGTTKLLATTQFQPTDARKAFPCFDEPAFKAKFSIEMAREEQMNTISNMPLVDSIPVVGQEGWFWDRFNTTLPMSTYLVAFIVSEFGYLEGESTDTYAFRVWARKNALSNGAYAAELGPKVSKFFEDFFNVPFPLPKQDMAAVPDFSAHAMENWGLIIYRESSFLYDPTVAKALDKMRVASVISHEIAHQWFGDLVTPVWWTDLWLNEGFASYMEYIGLRDTEASLNPMDQFVVNDVHSAFALDSLESSHPISVPVEHPDEINALFDRISYLKGASIIRMMSSFLTEESFRKGLSKYLTDYSYSNAEQNDLWKYLSDQAHADGTLETNITVKDIMDTWTLQMGYPVITVKRNTDGSGTLTQERFLVSKNENPVEDSHDYKWWVPITFTSQTEGAFNDTTPRVWMNPSESTKVIQGLPNANEWFIFNLGQSGYYRVNYEAENWAAIAAQLKTDYSVFPDSNRAQIIDDSLNLAKSGRLSYESALELLSYLRTEKSYVPIKAAFNNFKFIANMLSFTGGYGLLKNYLLSLIIPLYEEVNFADSLTDSHLEQRKRAEILQWACTLGHQPCVDASVDLFKKWMEDPQNDKIVSPNLKSIVYCTAIKEGGPKEWKFAWDRYESSLSGTQQKELLEAMGCSRDIWILSEYLDRALSPDKGIKKQMVRFIIPAIAQNDIGSFVAWRFLRNRWGNIIDYFGSVSFVLDDIVGSVMSPLNTQVQLNEMTSFREEYKGRFSSAARAIDQATERLKNNIAWMENSYDTITQWLQNNGYQSEV